jgi:hypothetical protein
MLLLSQECWVNGWRDSNRWADFGGRSKNTLESPEATAARETWEESGGVIYDESTWLEKLKARRYLCYYDYELAPGKLYRTYVIQVEYKDYPAEFSRMYNYMQFRGIDVRKVLEKRQLRWISFEQLAESIAHIELKFSRPLKLRCRFYKSTKQNWEFITQHLCPYT